LAEITFNEKAFVRNDVQHNGHQVEMTFRRMTFGKNDTQQDGIQQNEIKQK
jgi:hypothetical protein